jgi:acetylornithine deacetylase/succinyl-diaminopimelate desuccinylase-like protein
MILPGGAACYNKSSIADRTTGDFAGSSAWILPSTAGELMKRIPLAAAFLGLLTCASSRGADAPPAPVEVPDAVKGITARELGGHMKFLASDLMRGRDTASHEARIAAEYLASRLSAAGAQPAGDSGPDGKTYLQSFPLEVVTPEREGTSVTILLEQNGSKRVLPCQLGVDVVFRPRGIAQGEIEAPVVFVGFGEVDAAKHIDDYDGLDLKGRFALSFTGQRTGKNVATAERAKPARSPRGRRTRISMAAQEKAAERGALGIIRIPSPSAGAGDAPDAMPTLESLGFGAPSTTLGRAPVSVPNLSFAEPVRELILKTTELAPESKPRLIEGLRIRFKYTAKKELKEDRNVIGFFPGTDKDKAKEVVIYSAHYDHVGVDKKGEIYNGSDDNASGTSALLEIAEAFGDGPRPARSVAFLWVSGEEKGLLGSKWFSEHVTLPEDYKIVADINLDMVSRNDGTSIGITPSDKHADYSTLVTDACAAAKAEGLTTRFDADEFYARTDSYHFARKGIPIVFFFCGVHEDYHQPTDDVAKADFEKAARVARSAYRLGWQVAQAKDVPKKITAESAKTADRR